MTCSVNQSNSSNLMLSNEKKLACLLGFFITRSEAIHDENRPVNNKLDSGVYDIILDKHSD